MELASLLAALGREPDDLISITQRADDKLKLIGFYKVKDVPSLELAGDVYFSVNPLDPEKVAQLEFGKRGGSDCVSRLTTLWIDLDSKESGMGSEQRCTAFVEHMSQVLGVSPVAVVHTGTGGMHPYWALTDSIPPSMLRAWGELVKSEAKEFGGSVDSVFDPARILRVPGTIRANGSAVSLQENPDPLAIEAEQLTQLVLPYVVTGTKITATAVAFETWKPAQQTCPYVLSMIERWPDEQPNDRHHWLLNKMNRLMAAARLGCITTEDFNTGERTAIQRFRELVFDRGERDGEIMEIIDRAKQDTERKTEQYLRTNELDHDCLNEGKTKDIDPGAWELEDLSGYIDGTIEPIMPIYLPREDGVCLLYPGKTHSIHGESESGKSLLMQWESARILGQGGSVLYLDYESDPRSVITRLKLMGVTREQFANFGYHRPTVWHAATEEVRARFTKMLDHPWNLVVIDGVTDALNDLPQNLAREVGGTGGNNGVTAWHREFPQVIAETTGAAVSMIDHKAKNSKGRDAAGAQSKMANLTGAAYVVEPIEQMGRGLIGRLSVKVGKDREGEVRRHGVNYDSGTRLADIANVIVDGTNDQIRLILEAPPNKLDIREARQEAKGSTLKTQISWWLAGQGGPRNTREIREAIGGDPNKYTKLLQELTAEGFIKLEKRGSANFYSNIAVYGADPQSGMALRLA